MLVAWDHPSVKQWVVCGRKKKGEFVSIFDNGIFLCLGWTTDLCLGSDGQSILEFWFRFDPDWLVGFEEMDSWPTTKDNKWNMKNKKTYT